MKDSDDIWVAPSHDLGAQTKTKEKQTNKQNTEYQQGTMKPDTTVSCCHDSLP